MRMTSPGPTFVDDRKVAGSHALPNGSRVRFGDLQFILRF